MKKRIMTVIPNPKDATSLYRGIGPISRLSETYENDLIFTTTKDYSWVEFQMQCDVLFMQRPFTQTHLSIATMAKQQRKKIVIDYDDDLLSVPDSNPTFSIYGKEEIKKNVLKLLSMADHVTCSTEHLSKTYLKFNKNITTVNNALDFKLFGYSYSKRDSDQNNLVFWRGSATHDADLMAHAFAIQKLIEENQNYIFHFQGGVPWYFKRVISKNENVIFADGVDPFEYFELITKVRPVLWLVPLEDNQFNRSKSNIAWIEAIASGGVALAPNWEEWKNGGTLNYSSTDGFYNQANEFLKKNTDAKNHDLVRRMNEQGWNDIINKYDIAQLNKKRAEIFMNL